MSGYVPPGWPDAVRPPGETDWEDTASAFLLDCCPADYRGHPVLRRHPVVLAVLARDHVAAQLDAGAKTMARLRTGLADFVSEAVVQQAVDTVAAENARLVRRLREVELVAEALRGKVFVRRL